MGIVITSDPGIAVEVLARGNLCAIPTETVYGLGALATNEKAIASVYKAKGRPTHHPLIVHVGSLAEIDAWINQLPDWAIQLARQCWPGPLTLVGNRTARVLDSVTGGQDTVAVRIPSHPLTLHVLNELSDKRIGGVVAPSANRFGHVSPTTAAHVQSDLGDYLASHQGAILDGGPCTLGVESTIVLATQSRPVILRPGGITRKMITDITGLEVAESKQTPRVSGSLASHYAPEAKVIITTESALASANNVNTGVIAFHEVQTPTGMVRLSAPANIDEFAASLYASLRHADELGLATVLVVEPADEGLAEAVRDRLHRAAH